MSRPQRPAFPSQLFVILWGSVALVAAALIARGTISLGDVPEAGHIVAHLVIFGVMGLVLVKPYGPTVALWIPIGVGAALEVVQCVASWQFLWSEGLFDVAVDALGALTATALTGENRVAVLFGKLLHPLVLLPLGLLSTFYTASNSVPHALVWTAIVLLSLLCPILFWLVGVRRGRFSNFDLTNRAERPILFLVATASLAAVWLPPRLCHASPDVVRMADGMAMSAVLITAITVLGLKVSGHVSIPLLLGIAISSFSQRGAFVFFAFAALLSWARIRGGFHRKQEVLGTWILGGAVFAILRLVH